MLAINAMFKLPKGELLLPDAPELIEKVRSAPAFFRPGSMSWALTTEGCSVRSTWCVVWTGHCRHHHWMAEALHTAAIQTGGRGTRDSALSLCHSEMPSTFLLSAHGIICALKSTIPWGIHGPRRR